MNKQKWQKQLDKCHWIHTYLFTRGAAIPLHNAGQHSFALIKAGQCASNVDQHPKMQLPAAASISGALPLSNDPKWPPQASKRWCASNTLGLAELDLADSRDVRLLYRPSWQYCTATTQTSLMQLRSNIAHADKSMRSRVFSSVPFQHHRAFPTLIQQAASKCRLQPTSSTCSEHGPYRHHLSLSVIYSCPEIRAAWFDECRTKAHISVWTRLLVTIAQ